MDRKLVREDGPVPGPRLHVRSDDGAPDRVRVACARLDRNEFISHCETPDRSVRARARPSGMRTSLQCDAQKREKARRRTEAAAHLHGSLHDAHYPPDMHKPAPATEEARRRRHGLGRCMLGRGTAMHVGRPRPASVAAFVRPAGMSMATFASASEIS